MMEYQKFGRGGAGNFHTPRVVGEASREKTEARMLFAILTTPRSRLSRTSKPSAVLPVEGLKV